MEAVAKIEKKPVFNKETGGYDYETKRGHKLHIREGKTKDLMQAQKEAEGNASRVPLILVSLLCTLDGKRMVVEAWEELPLQVGSDVLTAFSEVNF
jgi:hypothetical protein